MTEYELLRIITFLEGVKGPYQELIPIAEEDASWNMVLYLIKQNLTGSAVTMSSATPEAPPQQTRSTLPRSLRWQKSASIFRASSQNPGPTTSSAPPT